MIHRIKIFGYAKPLRSHLHRPAFDAHGGLADRLRPGGMSMTGAREIFSGTTELHQYGCFVYHLARNGANNMNSQNAVCWMEA